MKWRVILLSVPVLVLLGAGAAYLFREQLANQWIRARLATDLSAALGADVDLQGVKWKSGVLQARRLRVTGGDLPFLRLEARDVRAVVDWRRLLQPADQPLHVEAAEAELVWREHPGEKNNSTTTSGSTPVPPLDFLVNRLDFRHRDLKDWSIEGSSMRALYRDGVWSLSGKGGSLFLPPRHPLEIERLSAEHRDGRWHIGGFAVKDKAGGVLAGSAVQEGDSWAGEFSWQDVDIMPALPAAAAAHVEGASSGDAALKDGKVTGHMKIARARTKAVGLFVKMASLLDREDLSMMPWKIFQFEFTRHPDGRVDFSDLQALSEKGVAVRGQGHYASDSISADLQVGVRRQGRPYLGAFVPILFSHERDGYCWTAVKVGGSPEAPTENLSARVAAALAVAPAAGVMESAVEVPAAAGEAVGGLLRGLLRH